MNLGRIACGLAVWAGMAWGQFGFGEGMESYALAAGEARKSFPLTLRATGEVGLTVTAMLEDGVKVRLVAPDGSSIGVGETRPGLWATQFHMGELAPGLGRVPGESAGPNFVLFEIYPPYGPGRYQVVLERVGARGEGGAMVGQGGGGPRVEILVGEGRAGARVPVVARVSSAGKAIGGVSVTGRVLRLDDGEAVTMGTPRRVSVARVAGGGVRAVYQVPVRGRVPAAAVVRLKLTMIADAGEGVEYPRELPGAAVAAGTAVATVSVPLPRETALPPEAFLWEREVLTEAAPLAFSGSGEYRATAGPLPAGLYTVEVTARGPASRPFVRRWQEGFRVAGGGAQRAVTVRDEPADTDGDGRPDTIRFTMEGAVAVAGRYELSVDVGNPSQETASAVRTVRLPAGRFREVLELKGDDVRSLPAVGPYPIYRMRVLREVGSEVEVVFAGEGPATRAYRREEFARAELAWRPGARLTVQPGPGGAAAGLEATLPVAGLRPGSRCTVTGVLHGAGGRMASMAESAWEVTPKPPVARLFFPGVELARGPDGPYVLRDVSIVCERDGEREAAIGERVASTGPMRASVFGTGKAAEVVLRFRPASLTLRAGEMARVMVMRGDNGGPNGFPVGVRASGSGGVQAMWMAGGKEAVELAPGGAAEMMVRAGEAVGEQRVEVISAIDGRVARAVLAVTVTR